MARCRECGGSGEIDCIRCYGSGKHGVYEDRPCAYCKGTGRQKCPDCGGSGRSDDE